MEIKKYVITHYLCLLNRQEVCLYVCFENMDPLGLLLLFPACHIPDYFDRNLCFSLDLLLPIIWGRSEAFPWQLPYNGHQRHTEFHCCFVIYMTITTHMKHLKLTAKEYLIASIITKWSTNIILDMIGYYNFFLTFGLLIFSQ